jgi:hypothetical protein
LSPPEYKAFGTYLQALTGRSSVTPSSVKPDTTFPRNKLRQIAQEKIGVDAETCYKVCRESTSTEEAEIQVSEAISPKGQDLTVGQVLACFRLMSHARTAMNRPRSSSISPSVDLALLFVPSELYLQNEPEAG